MNPRKPIKIHFLLKFIPIILYFLVWIPDVWSKKGPLTVNDLAYEMFMAVFALFIIGWGLVFFEVYIFLSPKGNAKNVMGIISIVLSSISLLWMVLVNVSVLLYEKTVSFTMMAVMLLNFLYIAVAALILAGKVTT